MHRSALRDAIACERWLRCYRAAALEQWGPGGAIEKPEEEKPRAGRHSRAQKCDAMRVSNAQQSKKDREPIAFFQFQQHTSATITYHITAKPITVTDAALLLLLFQPVRVIADFFCFLFFSFWNLHPYKRTRVGCMCARWVLCHHAGGALRCRILNAAH